MAVAKIWSSSVPWLICRFEREHGEKRYSNLKKRRKHLQNIFASSDQQENWGTLTIMYEYTFKNWGCCILKDCLRASSSFSLYPLSVYKSRCYKSKCNVLNYKILYNLFRTLALVLLWKYHSCSGSTTLFWPALALSCWPFGWVWFGSCKFFHSYIFSGWTFTCLKWLMMVHTLLPRTFDGSMCWCIYNTFRVFPDVPQKHREHFLDSKVWPLGLRPALC